MEPAAKRAALSGTAEATTDDVHRAVAEYYGTLLQSSKDLKTSACCAASRPPQPIVDALNLVPDAVLAKFYGCGSPLPAGGLDGMAVLDLGSGSGRDAYVAAKLVGPTGRVVGVDFTDEQLQTARQHADAYCQTTLKYPSTNMCFIKGYIEDVRQAGVQEGAFDLVISNCVVNLSPDKAAVLRGMYYALKHGGEAVFSDVYCDRRLPDSVRAHKVLWGECIAGALYVEDFLRLARAAGFEDPRELTRARVDVADAELRDVVGAAQFYSITYRLFKLPSGRLESKCEDYGQTATYLGTLAFDRSAYRLDDHHVFEAFRPQLVCGNTAAMLADTWLGRHFSVTGDRSRHFGLFPCAPPPPTTTTRMVESQMKSGGCC